MSHVSALRIGKQDKRQRGAAFRVQPSLHQKKAHALIF
jgi:hypothetical protein